MLLLVIDGRQPGMEGGNMKTVMDIMWEYGAVNAANLDGRVLRHHGAEQ